MSLTGCSFSLNAFRGVSRVVVAISKFLELKETPIAFVALGTVYATRSGPDTALKDWQADVALAIENFELAIKSLGNERDDRFSFEISILSIAELLISQGKAAKAKTIPQWKQKYRSARKNRTRQKPR